MSARRGATLADWRGLTDTLGLTVDLLPVVSDTGLPVSPHSQLSANPDQLGKVPSVVNATGHITGILKWAQHESTRAQCVAWARDEHLGVCVIGRQIKAIDIDVADPVLAQRVQDMFTLLLGDLPERFRSNSGKRLLPVRLPVYMPKWRFEVAGAEGAVVEILGDSQQFIAAGTHPSGVRYEWRGGLPTEIPEVTLDELQDAVRAVYEALGVPGTLRTGRAVLEGAGVRRSTDSTDQAFVDWLWDHGQVVDEAADGALYVVCPWQHEHTDGAAGAPSSTVVYPAGVGAEKRGFKCMHAHCEGRDIHAYEAAPSVGWYAHEVETQDGFEDEQVPRAPVVVGTRTGLVMKPFESAEPWPNWARDKKGIISTHTSIGEAVALPHVCGARIAYDEFKAETMIEWHHRPGVWRPVENTDNYDLCMHLERVGFISPSDRMVDRAVAFVGRRNKFDSARDWLSTKTWDGVERAERFFIDYWGAADTPYTRACGRYIWSAMAARVEMPGCKADMTPVLISQQQGLRKTAGVMAMAPDEDAFVELTLDTPDKELAYKIRGKLVGELGEMSGMSKRDQEGLKNWLSRPFEEFREVFQPRPTKFKRRVLFLGTGNREEILEDETGNRRWLPMLVQKVDDERIVADRDQLWAEGKLLFCANGHMPEWQDAQTLAVDVHPDFSIDDPWTDIIKAWLDADAMDGAEGPKRGEAPLRGADILMGALGFKPDGIRQADQKRMGRAMRNLGFDLRPVRFEGGVAKRWVAKNSKSH